jgi:hypothetical protein
MICFNGAVSCTKERLQNSINNYKSRLEVAKFNLRNLIEKAKQTPHRILWIFPTTLYEAYSDDWNVQYGKIADKLGIEISKQDIELVDWPYPIRNIENLAKIMTSAESICYLSPDQAGFVSKWENYKVA